MSTLPRAFRPFLIAVCAGFAQPAAADMSGHWLHAGDPAGLVVGFLEELVIPVVTAADPQGMPFEVRVHRQEADHSPICTDGPAPPEACSDMIVTDRGRLLLDPAGKTLTVLDAEVLANPFVDEIDMLGWEMVALATVGAWRVSVGQDRIELSRQIDLEDAPRWVFEYLGDEVRAAFPYTQTKLFFRVPEGFAADLLVVLSELSMSGLTLSGCVVEALAAHPPVLSEVATEAALAGPVLRQLRALRLASNVMSRGVARTVFETTLLPFQEQASMPDMPVVAAGSFAPEKWAAAVRLARFHRQDPDVAVQVLFPQALPYRDEIAACEERLYADAL